MLQVDGRQKAWARLVAKPRKTADGLQKSRMIVSSFLLLTQQTVELAGDSKLLQEPVNQRCGHSAADWMLYHAPCALHLANAGTMARSSICVAAGCFSGSRGACSSRSCFRSTANSSGTLLHHECTTGMFA